MTLPTFNIDYQRAYTSTIEFQTQINEKQQGREQRYPKWTYPKRTFTLKFDKNFAGRQELENFFIEVMGQAGKFYWVWDEARGGNGKTYTCNFDSDSFKQNIKDLGYTECELKLVAIDETLPAQNAKLDFWHKAECENSIEFYTVIDKVFTFQNNRKAWWSKPKKSWTLTFDKSSETRKKIENFFIQKRGKFRSFQWTWDKERGGDGQTYTVRFDDDTLQSDIQELGYGNIQIKLKEVFASTNPLSEVEKDEIIPRKLLKIELEGGNILVLDNETLDTLIYNGDTYIGAPLSHGEITKDDNSAVNKVSIELSNVALQISGIIGNRGDVINNAPATLTLVFLDLNKNTIISGYTQILYAGKCNNLELNYETAKMDIETSLGGYEIQAPIMKYRTSCQVRRFKDCRCGYKGTDFTTCDRTWANCQERNNTANFRGFPSIPAETIIKA
nr:MAG TPA: minor tail protein [Caudoviricetes sp.]